MASLAGEARPLATHPVGTSGGRSGSLLAGHGRLAVRPGPRPADPDGWTTARPAPPRSGGRSMAKGDGGGSTGRRDAVVGTVADVVGDAKDAVTPLPKAAAKELRKLE